MLYYRPLLFLAQQRVRKEAVASGSGAVSYTIAFEKPTFGYKSDLQDRLGDFALVQTHPRREVR
jgi:hypothetical protein